MRNAIRASIGTAPNKKNDKSPSGQVWPNGEFGVGYYCDYEETTYQDEYNYVLANPSESEVELTPEVVSSLTLSDVPNSDKRGLKGLTTYGARMVRSGCYLLESKLGREDCMMWTLTVPTLNREGRVQLARNKLVNELVKGHAYENSFKLNINPDDNEFEVSTPFLYHDSVFTAILSEVIGENVYLQQSAPLPLQKTTYSFPKDSLIIKLLHDSDNLIAEQLLLMISKKITDSLKTEAGITALENSVFHDISKDIKWVDGSGLSRYNLLSPWAILFVLKKIY
jgi:hypothetical protein